MPPQPSPTAAADVPVAVPAARTATPPPRRGWRQLALLSGLISMDHSEVAVVTVLFPAMRAALGLPLSALGILVAVGKVISTVCGPLWVAVAARWGRKNVLVVFCGLWGLWACAAGLAQNFTQLLILYGIASIGFAAGGPLVNGLIGDLFDDSARGRASGLLYGGVALITAVLGPLLGQLSRVEDGWRYGFFASGLITAVFGVLVWRFFDDPGVGAADGQTATQRHKLTRAQIHELLSSRTLQLIIVQRFLAAQHVMQGFAVVFLVDVRGYTTAQASLIVPVAGLAYLAGTIGGGIVIDRAQQLFPRFGRLAVWQAATLGWVLVTILGTQVAWPALWIYAIIFGVIGLLQGSTPAANRPLLISVVRPELRSAAFAVMLTAESAAWALTSVVVGFAADHIGLQAALLYIVIGLMLANGLFMTAMYRPYMRESAAVRAHLAESGSSTTGM